MRPLPLLFAVALSLPAAARAAEAETTWMQVLLDGRKIGHLESRRERDGDRVITTERMEATIDRAGIGITLRTEERSIETEGGRPLGFTARTELSGVATEVEGDVGADGQIAITLRAGDRVDRRTMPWPEGALLAQGLQQAERERGLEPGTRYRLLAFQPSNLVAVPIEIRVHGEETVTLGLSRETLVRLDQTIELPGAPIETRAWVDRDFGLRRASLPMMGLTLEMLACDEACARAPNQPADILDRTMVDAPAAIEPDTLGRALEFRVALDGGAHARLPDLAEQDADVARDGEWRVRIDPASPSRDRRAPEPADRAATRWLESDAPALIAMARRVTDGIEGDAARMAALERAVRAHIDDKTLSVGYASALETLESRQGDCTEHALLLAALGRAVGIPTRVANGLAYAPHYAGRDHVFVPHAWVQAFVDGAWESFDAALPRFDAGHLAFTAGDGDPAGFYAGVNLLGNVRILELRPAP